MDFSSRELPGLFFRKVIRDDMGQISLDPQMIRLLLAIDDSKSLAQVAKEVGMTAVTDDEGYYSFPKLTAGEHTFQVLVSGKKVQETSVTVPSTSYDLEV